MCNTVKHWNALITLYVEIEADTARDAEKLASEQAMAMISDGDIYEVIINGWSAAKPSDGKHPKGAPHYRLHWPYVDGAKKHAGEWFEYGRFQTRTKATREASLVRRGYIKQMAGFMANWHEDGDEYVVSVCWPKHQDNREAS